MATVAAFVAMVALAVRIGAIDRQIAIVALGVITLVCVQRVLAQRRTSSKSASQPDRR